jgi:hypothetical protein
LPFACSNIFFGEKQSTCHGQAKSETSRILRISELRLERRVAILPDFAENGRYICLAAKYRRVGSAVEIAHEAIEVPCHVRPRTRGHPIKLRGTRGKFSGRARFKSAPMCFTFEERVLEMRAVRYDACWLVAPVVESFRETVQHAVIAEFDRYFGTGDLARTRDRLETAILAGKAFVETGL